MYKYKLKKKHRVLYVLSGDKEMSFLFPMEKGKQYCVERDDMIVVHDGRYSVLFK